MSYVSKDSFHENKAEPMTDTIITTINHHSTNSFLLTHLIHQQAQSILRNSMQIRGFITQRNVESQLKRNPSFLTRIQQAFCKYFL